MSRAGREGGDASGRVVRVSSDARMERRAIRTFLLDSLVSAVSTFCRAVLKLSSRASSSSSSLRMGKISDRGTTGNETDVHLCSLLISRSRACTSVISGTRAASYAA